MPSLGKETPCPTPTGGNDLPKVHPVAAKRDEVGYEGSIVELKGFVGSASNQMVRLFVSRSMSTYLDIPTADILYFVDPESEIELTKIFVRASALILHASSRSRTLSAEEAVRPASSRCGCSGPLRQRRPVLRRLREEDKAESRRALREIGRPTLNNY